MWFVSMKKSRLASLLLLLSFVHATVAQASARRDILSYAGEKRYWVVQVVPPGTRNATGAQSEIRTRESAGVVAWRRVAILQGRVTDIAHRNADAAVLFDNQSWLLVWPDGSSTGPRLPGAAIIRALGSDEQSLWAMGVHAAPSTQAVEHDASTHPLAPAVAPGTLQTFLFTGAGWQARAVVPEDLTNERSISFAVFDSRPMVAWQFGERELRFIGLGRDGTWAPVESIQTDFAITDFRLLARAPTPTLWIAGKSSAGELRTRREVWGAPIPLQAEPPMRDAVHRTAEYFAGNVRLLALAEGRLVEQAFGLDGAASGKPIDLGRTPPPQQQPISVWSIVLMAIMAMLLSTAIFRSESKEKEGAAKQSLPLAPFPRRLAAGLIDLSPLLLTLFWQVPWSDSNAAAAAMQDQSTVVYVASAMFVYLLHTTLLELLTGKTVGKMICRLRVVSVDGKRAGKLAIVIRNLIRIIDVLTGAPVAMLILFLPLRQRLGDVLAGTTVIVDAVVPVSEKRIVDDAPGETR